MTEIFNIRVDGPQDKPDICPVGVIDIMQPWQFEAEILTEECNGEEWVQEFLTERRVVK